MFKFTISLVSLFLMIVFTGCDSKDILQKSKVNMDENLSNLKVSELQKSEYKVVYNGNTLGQLEILQNISNEFYISTNDFLLIMECKMKWDKETKSMSFSINNKEIKLKANDKFASVNGQQIEMGGLNILADENLLSPLQFLAEATGLKYQKDDKHKTVKLSSEKTIKVEKGSNLKEDIVPKNKEIKLEN